MKGWRTVGHGLSGARERSTADTANEYGVGDEKPSLRVCQPPNQLIVVQFAPRPLPGAIWDASRKAHAGGQDGYLPTGARPT